MLTQHAFVYVAVLTTLVGVGVTAVYGWATGLAAPDKPEISVSDSSATLTDLSYVYEKQILETPATLPPGGVKASSIRLKLLVQNSTGASVRILDIQARVAARSAPVGGTLIARVPQGSASEVIGIGLWQDPPIARILVAGKLGDPFFAVQSIEIPDGESQVIEVTLMADEHRYRYALDVTYAREGTRASLRLDTSAFEVSGYASTYPVAYEQHGGQFRPIDQAQATSFVEGHRHR
jgi:hypothetical protein